MIFLFVLNKEGKKKYSKNVWCGLVSPSLHPIVCFFFVGESGCDDFEGMYILNFSASTFQGSHEKMQLKGQFVCCLLLLSQIPKAPRVRNENCQCA